MSSNSKAKKKNAAGQSPKTKDAQKQNTSGQPPKTKDVQKQNVSGQAPKTKVAQKQTNVLERLLGVITLKRPIYREIAHDSGATVQAGIIVVVVALIVGLVTAWAATNLSLESISGAAPVRNPLVSAIGMVIREVLIWLAASWFIAAVARGYFHGKTDTGEMLRVFGYTRVFQILLVVGVFSGLLAALVSIAGLAASVIGTIIGIQEATGFSMGRAAGVAIFAIVLVSVLVAFLGVFVLNPIFTTLLPT